MLKKTLENWVKYRNTVGEEISNASHSPLVFYDCYSDVKDFLTVWLQECGGGICQNRGGKKTNPFLCLFSRLHYSPTAIINICQQAYLPWSKKWKTLIHF